MKTKPNIRTTAVLLLVAGFALGFSTFTGAQPTSPSVAGAPADLPLPTQAAGSAGPAPDVQFPVDDPGTKKYEPFTRCSADYAGGPGGDLDRKNMIAPENSVIATPEEMKALGMPEAAIRSQTAAWQALSPEEREEQLCRAAQQGRVIEQ